MASIINLEDFPQLVMEKIASFLNHKQLLVLEQVSRKLKFLVDEHFSLTDHLIIGSLPEVDMDFLINDVEPSAEDKKSLDGLLKTIKRCGIRLRTIQITIKDQFCSILESLWNYFMYLQHIFASAEVSDICPYVENIIAYPNMESITMTDTYMLRQQNVLLHLIFTEIYANNIKISRGESCRLRSISLVHPGWLAQEENSYERILNLYSHLEHMAVYDVGENFFTFLPQFIENGLKDLDIFSPINFLDAKRYCNIGKDLRSLRLRLRVANDDDIAALNKLKLPTNLEIIIRVRDVDNYFGKLSENVCSSIITCTYFQPTDFSLMTKCKNLQEMCIRELEQFKVIAEGSFPELKRINNYSTLCYNRDCDINTCDLQIYLPKLLTNKGDQLTFIEISCDSCIPIDLAWKALKHCTAAKSIEFGHLVVDLPLLVTADDMKAICLLPNLQHFMFWRKQRLEDDATSDICELMKRTVKEHTDFRFRYKLVEFGVDSYWVDQKYSLCRTHF